MKHFCGIIAHKNPEQLQLLANQLTALGMDYRIHLDAKSRDMMLSKLGDAKHKVTGRSHRVHRGHFSLVEAAFELMQESTSFSYDYFHLISGEDLCIKSREDFNQIFQGSEGSHFINHYSVPLKDDQLQEGGIPPEHYRHFAFGKGVDMIASRHFPSNSGIQALHKRLGKYRTYWRIYHGIFGRAIPDIDFYLGSAWFSVGQELIGYFLEQKSKQNPLIKFSRQSLFPDEFVFQSLAMNSPFKTQIQNIDLRFVQWSNTSPKRPKVLDIGIWDNLLKSPHLFARKWNIMQESSETLKRILDV